MCHAHASIVNLMSMEVIQTRCNGQAAVTKACPGPKSTDWASTTNGQFHFMYVANAIPSQRIPVIKLSIANFCVVVFLHGSTEWLSGHAKKHDAGACMKTAVDSAWTRRWSFWFLNDSGTGQVLLQQVRESRFSVRNSSQGASLQCHDVGAPRG